MPFDKNVVLARQAALCKGDICHYRAPDCRATLSNVLVAGSGQPYHSPFPLWREPMNLSSPVEEVNRDLPAWLGAA